MAIRTAKRATALANPVAATCFKTADNASNPVIAYLPAGASIFKLRAKGTATGGTTTNFTPVIQVGTSATAGSNTDFASGGAAAYNTANGSWNIEVLCSADAVNKTLSGSVLGHNGSAGTVIANVGATKKTSFDPALASNAFVVTGLFSATNASNACTLEHLSIEVIA